MATAHATCPECLRPIEDGGIACPRCGTAYHAACSRPNGCVVAGCGGVAAPGRAPAAGVPGPLSHRIVASAPDALFALWFAFVLLGCLTGNFLDAGSLCDPVLTASVVVGMVVYPGRALRARNAPIRRGLVSAFLMCIAVLLVLLISDKSRYGRPEPPEPMRILQQLMSSSADRSAWNPIGQRFYQYGLTVFAASMSLVGLALLAALSGVSRDRPRTRAAAVAIAAVGIVAVVMLAA
jgi:hypothetical protein